MSVLRATVYLVLILAAVLYVKLSLRTPLYPHNEIEIVQTHLGNLTDSILLEKLPVLVHDRIASAATLAASHFRFLYLFEEPHLLSEYTAKVTSRFLILHNTSEELDLTVDIGSTPSNKIPVALQPHNALVLPAGTYFRTHSLETTNALRLNDITHRLFFK